MYFSDTDDAGHGFSPDSEETKQAVARVDANIARLIAGLGARKIGDEVNIIIVSDHGMAAVDSKNAVLMDDYLDQKETDRVLTTGEIWQIFPKMGSIERIMAGLAKAKHTTCWRKADIPPRLHYSTGLRVAPVVCSSEEGYFMTTRDRYEVQKKRDDFKQLKGAHGYDDKYQSMMATFIARGRAFKRHKAIGPFSNVEVYNVMCKILGLTPATNDGNFAHVRSMLR
jgi:predicted AlkP superfamily pyrophosphatase or phosphodiesterase